MARAKKTARAEARRNARTPAPASAPGTATAQAAGGKASPSGSAAPTGASRPSLLGTFRDAVRPIDLRADIRDIPWLVTRTRAVWLPSLLVVGAALWYASSVGRASLQAAEPRAQDPFGAIAQTIREDGPRIAFQLFVYPPPQMGALFLAGILTERMSYMAGGIVGLVCGVVFATYLAIGPLPEGALDDSSRQVLLLGGLALSPVSGFLIGGFAGFYRRFLRRANPNAGRRQPPAKGKGTKAPARR